jgi:hypothetical protein
VQAPGRSIHPVTNYDPTRTPGEARERRSFCYRRIRLAQRSESRGLSPTRSAAQPVTTMFGPRRPSVCCDFRRRGLCRRTERTTARRRAGRVGHASRTRGQDRRAGAEQFTEQTGIDVVVRRNCLPRRDIFVAGDGEDISKSHNRAAIRELAPGKVMDLTRYTSTALSSRPESGGQTWSRSAMTDLAVDIRPSAGVWGTLDAKSLVWFSAAFDKLGQGSAYGRDELVTINGQSSRTATFIMHRLDGPGGASGWPATDIESALLRSGANSDEWSFRHDIDFDHPAVVAAQRVGDSCSPGTSIAAHAAAAPNRLLRGPLHVGAGAPPGCTFVPLANSARSPGWAGVIETRLRLPNDRSAVPDDGRCRFVRRRDRSAGCTW